MRRAGKAGRGPRLDRLLAAKGIVVACGPGGVGKTSTAAAIAATAAVRRRGRVLVVTVDPARRLAQALGLDGIGNAAVPVAAEAFAAAGVVPKGELYAAMLDTKESWDGLVRRHAPDEATAATILANPLYRNITGRFAEAHEYIAAERLFELHGEGAYDLIVVDTPPTRDALDFLDAPSRMADFFSSKLLKWLTAPYRSRLFALASRPFNVVADRILGTQLIEDLAEFFTLLETMYPGFVSRAAAVDRLLHDSRTTFAVVTTLEAGPAKEAGQFAELLRQRGLDLGLVVCNRALPSYLEDAAAGEVAEAMRAEPGRIAAGLASGRAAPKLERVLASVGSNFASFQLAARRESETLAEMAVGDGVAVTVPYLDSDITGLAELLELGRLIWGQG